MGTHPKFPFFENFGRVPTRYARGFKRCRTNSGPSVFSSLEAIYFLLMTVHEPSREGRNPFIYTSVELPPADGIDDEWCADFSRRYGHQGFRYSGKAKIIVARDWPPELSSANTSTSYSAFYLPEAEGDGDLIDGEVVGARIFPFYPEDEDTGELIIDSPDLVPHIILADACNTTHYGQLSRTPGDLVSVPFDPDLAELILYH